MGPAIEEQESSNDVEHMDIILLAPFSERSGEFRIAKYAPGIDNTASAGEHTLDSSGTSPTAAACGSILQGRTLIEGTPLPTISH